MTLLNFIVMAIFAALLFMTLPGSDHQGSFMAFYGVFMVLFLTAGLGSGSTFQMIAVIFRKITVDRVKAEGGSDELAQREAVTDSAAALGFISAIGAAGGLYSQGVWYFAGVDWLTGWSDEDLPGVLYSVCRGDLGRLRP